MTIQDIIMGIGTSTATGMATSIPFNIERMIGPGIMVGVNRNGELIKIDDDYYPLKDVIKVNNRLEYIFEPNIYLSLERLNEKTKFGNYKLFYKLTQDRKVLIGETELPFKTISLNSPKLDLIAELQNNESINEIK